MARLPAQGHDPGPTALTELRWLTWVPVGAVGAVVALSLGAPEVAAALALPTAVVGALLGIPHGAVDHVVPWWSSDDRGAGSAPAAARRTLLLFAASYAAVAAAALAALVVAPTSMLVAFVLLSALHFGRGEVVTAAERAGRPTPTALEDLPTTLAHGLVVVGLLLWARPAVTDPFVAALSPWLAEAAAATRTAGILAVGAAVSVALVRSLRRGRPWEAAELALLTVAFSVASPLAAFGVYFGAWHAVRHTGRLLDLARRRSAHGDWVCAAALLGRTAIAPSAVAFAAVGVLWVVRDHASLQAEVAVLVALTFPHAAVVWAMDRREARERAPGRSGLAVPVRPQG